MKLFPKIEKPTGANARLAEDAYSHLRSRPAVTTKEQREKRIVLAHAQLELRGVSQKIWTEFHNDRCIKLIRDIALGRRSPEKGAAEITEVIKSTIEKEKSKWKKQLKQSKRKPSNQQT